MSAEVAAAKPETGVSVIFWLLIAGFAVAAAALATGDIGGVGVFALVLIGWVVSLCLHEWGHAFAAWKGGDDAIEARGYLTLNPLRYANPFLSLLLPLAFLAMGGIGFPGGAVYVRTGMLRGPWWRAGVSAAGPAMNLLCLIAIGLVFRYASFHSAFESSPLAGALALLAYLQATALLLNLLPVPGLDGFGILQAALPADARAALNRVSGVTVIVFLAVMIMAPQLLRPLWDGALALCQALWVGPKPIIEGLEMFRFWR